jgi:hypothetical protein
MRFALLHDYKGNKLDILSQQLRFIHSQRSTEFCTVFNYIAGSCSISVVALDSSSPDELTASTCAGGAFLMGLHRV